MESIVNGTLTLIGSHNLSQGIWVTIHLIADTLRSTFVKTATGKYLVHRLLVKDWSDFPQVPRRSSTGKMLFMCV